MSKTYLSDIDIARAAEKRPIAEVADKLNIHVDDLEMYGKIKVFNTCRHSFKVFIVNVLKRHATVKFQSTNRCNNNHSTGGDARFTTFNV